MAAPMHRRVGNGNGNGRSEHDGEVRRPGLTLFLYPIPILMPFRIFLSSMAFVGEGHRKREEGWG